MTQAAQGEGAALPVPATRKHRQGRGMSVPSQHRQTVLPSSVWVWTDPPRHSFPWGPQNYKVGFPGLLPSFLFTRVLCDRCT